MWIIGSGARRCVLGDGKLACYIWGLVVNSCASFSVRYRVLLCRISSPLFHPKKAYYLCENLKLP